jgi:TDG/mug DNA glycosylase family protein
LKLVIVGFNPGAVSAAQGHFYAKPGNQFYPLLFESGLTPRLLRPEEDRRLPTWGVGLADLCPWKAGQSNVLTPNDIRRGRLLLLERLKYYQPRMVAFNGLTLFKLVFGRTPKLGLQPEKIGTASLFVLLSTSGLVNGRWIERQALFADLADKVRALHLNA